MLRLLKISNILLIDDLEIDFSTGFNVFTGETGAGKSIIFDCLASICGLKSKTNLLRSGCDKGSISAEFDITKNLEVKEILLEQDIETSDILQIRRTFTADNKQKIFVNDTNISAALLTRIGENLVEIQGQHAQATLQDISQQLNFLDQYISKFEDPAIFTDVVAAFSEWHSISSKYKELLKQKEVLTKEEEYLRHIYNEINILNLQENEEEVLADKRASYLKKQKLYDKYNDANSILENCNLLQTIASFEKLANLTGEENVFSKTLEILDKAAIEYDEALSVLQSFEKEAEEFNIEEIEERLFKIRELSRKFNIHPSELQKFAEECQNKISNIDSLEADIKKNKEALAQAEIRYKDLSTKLSETRKKHALKLETAILEELKDLALEKTRFEIRFTKLDKFTEQGVDSIEFYISTNPGQPLGALNKIASGGELSRFMLAIKLVCQDKSSSKILLFDEIDTGVSGSVSEKIGKRLNNLGQNCQVFTITHQAQVSAKAHHHYLIKKEVIENKTYTRVALLTEAEKSIELARSLAGEKITDEAIQAAKVLQEG